MKASLLVFAVTLGAVGACQSEVPGGGTRPLAGPTQAGRCDGGLWDCRGDGSWCVRYRTMCYGAEACGNGLWDCRGDGSWCVADPSWCQLCQAGMVDCNGDGTWCVRYRAMCHGQGQCEAGLYDCNGDGSWCVRDPSWCA